jgi:hypothetical protein
MINLPINVFKNCLSNSCENVHEHLSVENSIGTFWKIECSRGGFIIAHYD